MLDHPEDSNPQVPDRRFQERENWVKYPVKLGLDLKTGILTMEEFALLSYMFSQCDRETGIIVTNSRLLSIEIDIDRKRVSNLLTSLKNKSRIRNPDRVKTELRQKRGNTKPYAILLCDALPNMDLDRVKTELRQSQDRAKTDGVDRRISASGSEPAETVGKSENGKILASERDLDLRGRSSPLPNSKSNTTGARVRSNSHANLEEREGSFSENEEEDKESQFLGYVIVEFQRIFAHATPIEVNSPLYETLISISCYREVAVQEALEACKKAMTDPDAKKRPRKASWILNRLKDPETFGVKLPKEKRTPEEDLVYWIEYCHELRGREKEVYPALVELAELIGKSVEEAFLQCEFLPNGLVYYEKLSKKKS